MSSISRITLKERVLSAGSWSLLGYVLSFAIRLGSNLFMTRQLIPEMFGVMAIAITVMVGLTMFSDIGLKPSIVQNKRGDESAFLNTAWVTQILRGLLLGCFAVSLSLLIPLLGRHDLIPKGSVYSDPSLPYVIAALSLTIIIAGFESTKMLQAARNLSLAKVTGVEIAAQILGLLIMVFWVLIDRSIWALVAGSVCSSFARTVLSHLWLPGEANRLQWEREAFDEIIRFGKWVFLSTLMYFIVSNGDRIFLGALTDAASLGIYAIAFLIFNSVDQIVTKIIVDVSFPALSEVARNNRAKLRETYYRFHLIIASFTYFCCGVLIMAGQAIVGLLYDRRYDQAGWILEILAVALLTFPFRMATQCFLALGLSKAYFHLHAIRVVTLFIALPLGFHFWGLKGATWGIVFSFFSTLPSTVSYTVSLGLFDLRKELLTLPVLIAGMLAGKALSMVIVLTTHVS